MDTDGDDLDAEEARLKALLAANREKRLKKQKKLAEEAAIAEEAAKVRGTFSPQTANPQDPTPADADQPAPESPDKRKRQAKPAYKPSPRKASLRKPMAKSPFRAPDVSLNKLRADAMIAAAAAIPEEEDEPVPEGALDEKGHIIDMPDWERWGYDEDDPHGIRWYYPDGREKMVLVDEHTIPDLGPAVAKQGSEAIYKEALKTELEYQAMVDKEKKTTLRAWKCPKYSIPVRGDVRTFDFDKLATDIRKLTGRGFDVIMTDPPWLLTMHNPTRGVAIGYDCLDDQALLNIPFGKLQTGGFLMMWVINFKMELARKMFEKWDYELVDDVTWIKMTPNRRTSNAHGYYLMHGKESCLVGRKRGHAPPPNCNPGAASDIIYARRSGQSQKPRQIYEYAETLCPNGSYLEIFARRNNLRDYWMSIGNEL